MSSVAAFKGTREINLVNVEWNFSTGDRKEFQNTPVCSTAVFFDQLTSIQNELKKLGRPSESGVFLSSAPGFSRPFTEPK